MKIKIRKANLKDLESIIEIVKESLKLHSSFDPSRYSKLDEMIKFYQKWLRESIQKNVFFVAENNKKVISYAHSSSGLWRSHYLIGNIVNIAVKKAYQGRGIGKRLLNEIIRSFKEKGCKEIIVKAYIKNKKEPCAFTNQGL